MSYFHITFISTKELWTTLQWFGIFSFCCFYPENSCLWNRKSDSYKNQQLRWKTLEHLRILLSAHPPPVNFTGEVGAGSFLKLHYNKHKPHAIVSFQWRTLRTNSGTFAPPFSITTTTWWKEAKSASQGCLSGSTTSSWCSYRAAEIRRKALMTCPPHHLLLHRGTVSPSSPPLDRSPSRQDGPLPPSPPPRWLKITGLKRESAHL